MWRLGIVNARCDTYSFHLGARYKHCGSSHAGAVGTWSDVVYGAKVSMLLVALCSLALLSSVSRH